MPAERTYVAKGITRVTENRKHRSSSNYLSKKSKAADINLKQINHNQQESTNHQIQLRLISQPPVAVLQAHPVLAQHPGAKQHSQGSTSYPKHHAHVVIQNPQIQFTKQQNLLLNGLTEQCNSIPQQASTVVPPASTR